MIVDDRIYEDFLTTCSPQSSDTILDFGVSDVLNGGANMLERLYPYPYPTTACGLGEAKNFSPHSPKSATVKSSPVLRCRSLKRVSILRLRMPYWSTPAASKTNVNSSLRWRVKLGAPLLASPTVSSRSSIIPRSPSSTGRMQRSK